MGEALLETRPGKDLRGRGDRGAALLVVLSVLSVLAILVSLLWDRQGPNMRAWNREKSEMQALYLAESGIAYQLYLEKYADSANASFGPGKRADSLADSLAGFPIGKPVGESFSKAPEDSFRFHLDTGLATPSVRVDRTRAYLDMTSTASYGNQQASLFARFGKAIDDSVFGPALTLENESPLEPFPPSQIRGAIREKTPKPGAAAGPWPDGFTVATYTAEFVDKKYYALESALQKQLAKEGGEGGNGNFDPAHPPVFTPGKDIFFPLGRVEIRNDGQGTWTLKGPGRIFAEGEIRVRGNIRLENVQLLSARDVIFEDSVSGEEVSAFARGSVFFYDRCRMSIEAVAAKDVFLRDRSQTDAGSVLLSVGLGKPGKAGKEVKESKEAVPDPVNAIRIVNMAVARGFLIAGSENGRVVLGTALNLVEGIIMAPSVWLAGRVHGAVLTRKLLCEGTNTRNCLGGGIIDRARLPQGFVQPLQLGPQDRKAYRFKILEWKRL